MSFREWEVEVDEAPESVRMRYELSRGSTEEAEPLAYREERGRDALGGVA